MRNKRIILILFLLTNYQIKPCLSDFDEKLILTTAFYCLYMSFPEVIGSDSNLELSKKIRNMDKNQILNFLNKYYLEQENQACLNIVNKNKDNFDVLNQHIEAISEKFQKKAQVYSSNFWWWWKNCFGSVCFFVFFNNYLKR